MHIGYCAQWGITLEELESTPESLTTTAYGAFLIDTGLKGANYPTETKIALILVQVIR